MPLAVPTAAGSTPAEGDLSLELGCLVSAKDTVTHRTERGAVGGGDQSSKVLWRRASPEETRAARGWFPEGAGCGGLSRLTARGVQTLPLNGKATRAASPLSYGKAGPCWLDGIIALSSGGSIFSRRIAKRGFKLITLVTL